MNDSERRARGDLYYSDYVRLSLWLMLYIFLFMSGIMMYQGCIRTGCGGTSRAKGTLRSIGSSQLAYQGTNNEHNYGSFQALRKTLYIAQGYTLGNMIENYSMTWKAYNLSTVAGEPGIHQFTVIAYPRNTSSSDLQTFCVTEDQVVRVYNPPNNDLAAIYHWDPIL